MYHAFMFLQQTVTPDAVQHLQDTLSAPSIGVEELLSTIAINYLSTTGIQYMKISGWKLFSWINHNTPWVTRVLVALSSSLTAIGIHKTWEPTTGTLIITGIAFWPIMHGLKHVVFNYALQHGWWKVLYAGREEQMRKAPVAPAPAPAPVPAVP